MLKEIVVAVLSAALVAIAGYVLVIKENQINIAILNRDLIEIKEISRKTADSLVATRLFIAQAHPDRDITSLVSLRKLQEFDDTEIAVLAEELPNVVIGPGPDKEIVNLPSRLRAIVEKHQLDGEDFEAYYEVATLPGKDYDI